MAFDFASAFAAWYRASERCALSNASDDAAFAAPAAGRVCIDGVDGNVLRDDCEDGAADAERGGGAALRALA